MKHGFSRWRRRRKRAVCRLSPVVSRFEQTLIAGPFERSASIACCNRAESHGYERHTRPDANIRLGKIKQ
jgi:hypothetical protein